jgi:hypothetical protein
VTGSQVVSVHFPKAGGTSLHRQLVALLGEAAFLDYAHDPLVVPSGGTSAFPVGARLVHGHFHAARYAAPGRCLVTFLREPVANLLSIYFFWRDLPPCGHAVHSRFLSERPSILDFARYAGIARLMSETYFGGFDMRRFDFIGFHETRQRDLPRLGRLLGLPLSHRLHENRTAPSEERQELDSSPRILAALRTLLAADIAFYERLAVHHANFEDARA